jgi:hypothetical protein
MTNIEVTKMGLYARGFGYGIGALMAVKAMLKMPNFGLLEKEQIIRNIEASLEDMKDMEIRIAKLNEKEENGKIHNEERST